MTLFPGREKTELYARVCQKAHKKSHEIINMALF
jgi:hypothetical protein